MNKCIIFIFAFFLFISCNSNRQNNKSVADGPIGHHDTFLAPHITVLNDLPDSSKPKIIALNKMPAPLVVAIPTHTGGHYNFVAFNGAVQKVSLEPPVKKMLPVLLDENNKPVKDATGSQIIAGDFGGRSDFTAFTTDNGLANDNVTFSFMDKAGNLWFGASGHGVSRYDGKSFVNFSTANGLVSNFVSCMTEDNEGNFWFGTIGDGLSRYDGKTFVTFSTAQGPSGNWIFSINCDKEGTIWIGTASGLSRYHANKVSAACCQGSCRHNLKDDKELGVHNKILATAFTNFPTKASSYITCMLEDAKGNLWFGSSKGIIKYNGNLIRTLCNSNFCKHNLKIRTELEAHNRELAGSFTIYSDSQGLANNGVLGIAADRSGNIWLATRGGISRYNGNVIPTACNSNTCKHNLLNPEDIKAHNKELKRSFVSFSEKEGLASKYVESALSDSRGNIWFCTQDGVSCYRASALDSTERGKKTLGSLITFKSGQGLENCHVMSIVEDKAGNLWFGTNGGLFRYNGGAFSNFSTGQGLAENNVSCITEDRNGDLWFGTLSSGVSHFDGKSFTSFSANQGIGNNCICGMLNDKAGNLWFATQGGGVTRYDGKNMTTFTTAQGLASNSIRCIAEDRNGCLWFGTYGGGVSKYDGRIFTTFSKAQGLAGNVVFSVIEDNTGNIWFGTSGAGISRYDGKSIISFTAGQGLAGNEVYNMLPDKMGNLWLATSSGLSCLSTSASKSISKYAGAVVQGSAHPEDMANKAPFFKTFTKADGLPDNNITQVLEMQDGKIIIASDGGLSIFRPSGDHVAITDIQTYNSDINYPVKNVWSWQNGAYLDSKGVIWAGTGSEKTALVRFDPSALHRSENAPALILKSVKVNEQSICWNDLLTSTGNYKAGNGFTPANITEEVATFGRALKEAERDSMRQSFNSIQFDGISRFYYLPQHLILPYSNNHIDIEFNAIETGRPELVKYQFMLEGYDKNWSPVAKNTTATYGNMREGTYTFRVKAQGPNGLWSKPLLYTFRVLPPWYRTWWAYLCYIFSAATALFLVFRWRTAALRRRQHELEQTVTERTAQVVAEKKEVEKQKKRSDELLLNILPAEVAEELKEKGNSPAKFIDDVTVLFTDFKGFTQMSEKLSPKALVAEINDCFSAFDNITHKYGIEKIKTIGDSYMAAGGLPVPNLTHATDVVKAALEIQQYMHEHKIRKEASGELFFQARIGIHTGPVVAGIVGVKKFQYDIWGDTVNTASRMESSGEVGKVNISQTTYELVKHKFKCEFRGEIDAKGKGVMKMYYVTLLDLPE